jgi:hypothetical protein
LEGTVELGIWGFAGLTKEQGIPLTAVWGIRQHLEMFVMLGHRKLPDEGSKAELVALNKVIDSLRERRNDVVHAKWERSKKSDAPYAMKYHRTKKGDWHVSIKPLSRYPEGLEARDIHTLANKILQQPLSFTSFFYVTTPCRLHSSVNCRQHV